MFTALKPLVTVGIMLCVISEGLAEDVKSPADSKVGTAYEFSGLTKYFTVSSKFLFGNKELLKSAIVDGYRVDLTNPEWKCLYKTSGNIVLSNDPGEWWSQTIYKEKVLENQNNLGEVIVVLNPPSVNLADIGCTQNIPPEKFVVDDVIAQKLFSKTKPTSDGR